MHVHLYDEVAVSLRTEHKSSYTRSYLSKARGKGRGPALMYFILHRSMVCVPAPYLPQRTPSILIRIPDLIFGLKICTLWLCGAGLASAVRKILAVCIERVFMLTRNRLEVVLQLN